MVDATRLAVTVPIVHAARRYPKSVPVDDKVRCGILNIFEYFGNIDKQSRTVGGTKYYRRYRYVSYIYLAVVVYVATLFLFHNIFIIPKK